MPENGANQNRQFFVIRKNSASDQMAEGATSETNGSYCSPNSLMILRNGYSFFP
jgi:hypothetical protein